VASFGRTRRDLDDVADHPAASSAGGRRSRPRFNNLRASQGNTHSRPVSADGDVDRPSGTNVRPLVRALFTRSGVAGADKAHRGHPQVRMRGRRC